MNPENGDSIDPEALRPLLIEMLQSRFGLKFHHESRELPLLALKPAKGGQKLQVNDGKLSHQTNWGKDYLEAQQVTIAELCRLLEPPTGLPVADKTNIQGKFDFHLKWSPEMEEAGANDRPSLFTLLKEEYGLELKPEKGPVDTIMIDRLQAPSEN